MIVNNATISRSPFIDINAVAAVILDTQKISGEIPWYPGGKTDPWDHVESAMGLSTCGLTVPVEQAFDWLIRMQLKDGSWYASYKNGQPADRTKDTNLSSYIAVGAYHHFIVTGDKVFLKAIWKTLKSAIDFTLTMQAASGEIYWAKSPVGHSDRMALLTGSSSVYMSLKCALAIARILEKDMPYWKSARERLGHALLNRPCCFNMTKSRFSMDWFYPILVGAVQGKRAQQRIDKFWKKFVIEGHGVRCVSDESWITIAETCELVITLNAMGNRSLAEIVFGWIGEKTFDDGSFWSGYTVPEMIVWPEEKMTWTNAGVLMAADSLYNITPAGRLFSHEFWKTSGIE